MTKDREERIRALRERWDRRRAEGKRPLSRPPRWERFAEIRAWVDSLECGDGDEAMCRAGAQAGEEE